MNLPNYQWKSLQVVRYPSTNQSSEISLNSSKLPRKNIYEVERFFIWGNLKVNTYAIGQFGKYDGKGGCKGVAKGYLVTFKNTQ